MTPTEPITHEDLNTMTPEQISTARLAGNLNHLLAPPSEPSFMTPAEGAAYLEAGHTHQELLAQLRHLAAPNA